MYRVVKLVCCVAWCGGVWCGLCVTCEVGAGGTLFGLL